MNANSDHPASETPALQPRSRHALSLLCVALAAMMGLSGCETPGQTALLGAATGAAIGGARSGGRGAVRGAAIGAGAGYVAGRIVQRDRDRAYRRGYYDARYADRRYYRDRSGDTYFIGRDGRRYYVD